jgi:uncharacterized RDD family membrane protein YckC
MSSAAQHDETSESYLPTGTDGGSALKQLAAERLAAHRNRRAVVEGRDAQMRRQQTALQAAIRLQTHRDAARSDEHPDASRVRDAVAARYQQSVSYREFLAVESQRALDKAQAEAEVAARSAKAVVEAQRQLLDEIEQWNQPLETAGTDLAESFDDIPLLEVVEPRSAEPAQIKSTGLTTCEEQQGYTASAARLHVRLLEEIDRTPAKAFYAPAKTVQTATEEQIQLDEEIAFRHAPEFADLRMETMPIQANIIEFPRQLVASRRARPRLAEGPLREDGTPAPQLRIFEVEAEQISLVAEIAGSNEAPEWQGLLLGNGQAQDRASMSPQLEAQLQLDHQIYAASLGRRLLSAMADALCVSVGLAGCAAVALKIAGDGLRVIPLPLLGVAAAGTLLFFAVLYQMLFFTLNEATPGMRLTRIAFCTFSEQSPTRRALRRRMLSTALAACPLGLGLVWTALDSDRLGWHDRMSRMYPRSY